MYDQIYQMVSARIAVLPSFVCMDLQGNFVDCENIIALGLQFNNALLILTSFSSWMKWV